jgi:hypothetical protein
MLQTGRSPVQAPDEVNFFNLPNPFSRTMALGSTQPLTKTSTRNLTGGKKRLARRAVCRMSDNVVLSTSRNPKGLHGLYRDNFTLPGRFNGDEICIYVIGLCPSTEGRGISFSNALQYGGDDVVLWFAEA